MLSAGEVLWIPRPESRLATLTSWTPRKTWPALRTSYPRWLAAMYVAELCGAVMREQDPHPEIYHRLVDMLDAIDAPADPMTEVLRTQWVVLCAMGHRLELDEDVMTHTPLRPSQVVSFLPAKGGFTTAPPDHEIAFGVRRSTLDALRILNRGEPLPPAREILGRASGLLHEAIRSILGFDLRSWEGYYAWAVRST